MSRSKDPRDIRIRELEKIVSRLPVTGDGVPVVPGDEVYDLRGTPRKVHYDNIHDRFWIPVSHLDYRRYPKKDEWIFGPLEVSLCYSTKDAARVAREGYEVEVEQ